MAITVLRVSQLNRYVKSQLEADSRLREVYVKGEIGTLSVNQRSGHLYFTLKDEESAVRAVMFAGNAQQLSFMPQSGLAVMARGAATLYERDGAFQIAVSELLLDGAGAMGLAFEQLKQRLAARGCFDEAKKRAIPINPKTVGVVTSSSGAALHDILTTIERRNPALHIIFAPAVVQGRQASASIARAIEALNRDGRSEVLIVGRGGGSAEDLWAFNEERTVLAVAGSAIPVVSAVGHETDFSLCDLAADLRAATPTAAAQLVCADRAALLTQLRRRAERMETALRARLDENARLLQQKKELAALKNPQFFVYKNGQRLNNLIQLMYNLSQNEYRRRAEQLAGRAALLDSLSPLKVLGRGYCVAQKDGNAVRSAASLQKGDNLCLLLQQGGAQVVVREICEHSGGAKPNGQEEQRATEL